MLSPFSRDEYPFGDIGVIHDQDQDVLHLYLYPYEKTQIQEVLPGVVTEKSIMTGELKGIVLYEFSSKGSQVLSDILTKLSELKSQ